MFREPTRTQCKRYPSSLPIFSLAIGGIYHLGIASGLGLRVVGPVLHTQGTVASGMEGLWGLLPSLPCWVQLCPPHSRITDGLEWTWAVAPEAATKFL